MKRILFLVGFVALACAVLAFTSFDFAHAAGAGLGGIALANAPVLPATFTADDIVKMAKQLEDIDKAVKEHAKEMTSKAAAGDKVTSDLKEKTDKALAEQGELRGKLEELGLLPQKYVEQESRIKELEQTVARRTARHEKSDDEKTPGELFIGSDDYKSAQTKGNKFRGRVTVQMKAITGASISVEPLRVPDIIPVSERRPTVRDLLTPGRTSSSSVQFVRETAFTNAAAAVAENATKPESSATFELVTANVATIAHWFLASKQVLEDAPMLQSHIDGRLRYGLMLEEEDQLLNGDGQGANLLGIIPQAADYNPAFHPSSEQRIDVIRLALLQAELAEYPATGIVTHPTDWARIELTKDSQNRYIFTSPQDQTTPRLWGRTVVATQAMDVQEFLVGAFRLGAQIFDREDANVQLSTEDDTNFRKNMVTILGEERLALTVYRQTAFVHGEYGDAS